jgi:tripartite-type tricarboxylate transporter receptor subunit TctC
MKVKGCIFAINPGGTILYEEGFMKGNKSKFFGILGIIALALPFGFPAVAAEYPTKPISLVIQYPAGGSSDLTSRALAGGAKKYLSVPIICENKAGGGGTVGVALVVTKPADGYTIGMVTSSPMIAYHMGKLNFHPINDLTPIIRWGTYLLGIVVRSDAQWKTMQELIQYAKQNPGKLSYGSPGVGTPAHLAMEELIMGSALELSHLPFKGEPDANNALLGGHIDIISASSGWAPLVDAGKFRLLATWGDKRSDRYPQIPTIKEIGYDVIGRAYLGVIGPKGMPKEIVSKLADAFKKAMDDREFLAVMKKFDMSSYYLGTEDYEKYMKSDFDNLHQLVRKLDLNKQ